MAGAPITMGTLLAYPKKFKFQHKIHFLTAGSPPPSAVIRQCEAELGVTIQTSYGMTETSGPAARYIYDMNSSHTNNSDNSINYQVPNTSLEELVILNPKTLEPVPADGVTMGEVMMRGNAVMKGYLKNQKATEETFAGGYLRSGDLGVRHPIGRIELKDRSKGKSSESLCIISIS